MKNHLHPNYKWILIFQHVISWTIFSGFIGITILVSALSVAQGNQSVIAFAVIAGVVIPIIGVIVDFFLALGIATWWYKNYTYELTDTVFKKEFGILTKRNTAIPYERIQNVDVVASLLNRIFGLAQLNIQTAGGSSYNMGIGGAEGRLPGLSRADAEKLQAELLRRARLHGPKHPAAPASNDGL